MDDGDERASPNQDENWANRSSILLTPPHALIPKQGLAILIYNLANVISSLPIKRAPPPLFEGSFCEHPRALVSQLGRLEAW